MSTDEALHISVISLCCTICYNKIVGTILLSLCRVSLVIILYDSQSS